MIRAVIIEDEKNARDALRSMINVFCPDVQILGEAEDGIEGLRLIEEKKPDLVFLDVRMPVCNGFEMLEKIGQGDFQLILTTAYANYALRAIKFSALDYLLKPIQIHELVAAVNKASSMDNKTFDRLEVFKGYFEGDSNKIVLPHNSGYKIVQYNQILRCQAERNYTYIHFINGEKLLASKTLKEFEDLLQEFNFFRIHQSHLINMNCVTDYIKGRGGQVRLVDGSLLDVARSKKTLFIGKLTAHNQR